MFSLINTFFMHKIHFMFFYVFLLYFSTENQEIIENVLNMTRRTNVLSVGMIAVHLKASSYEHGYSIEKAFPREKIFVSVKEIPLKTRKNFSSISSRIIFHSMLIFIILMLFFLFIIILFIFHDGPCWKNENKKSSIFSIAI